MLAQSISYTPFGATSTLVNGCAGTGCVQRQETYSYNKRLQVSGIELGTWSSPSNIYNLSYNYNLPGGTTPPGCPVTAAGSGNNGNVIGYTYTDAVNPGASHSALNVYDPVNRLACSQATGSSTYNLAYSYGPYGNVTCILNAYTNGPCPQFTYNTNNRLTTSGFSYDNAGDVTADAANTYAWDAEGHVKSFVSGGATVTNTSYNALGWRVYRSTSSGSVSYFRDPTGQFLGGVLGLVECRHPPGRAHAGGV
ncbi:MAG: hypothetical protein LAP13_14035 [Acidobacteriia bacterium]|nr:hypothetical protein [Terriglobia bacterium]